MTAPDPLAAEITAAIADYCRVWPVPYDLSPNLKLASRALGQLHRHTQLTQDMRHRRDVYLALDACWSSTMHGSSEAELGRGKASILTDLLTRHGFADGADA